MYLVQMSVQSGLCLILVSAHVNTVRVSEEVQLVRHSFISNGSELTWMAKSCAKVVYN